MATKTPSPEGEDGMDLKTSSHEGEDGMDVDSLASSSHGTLYKSSTQGANAEDEKKMKDRIIRTEEKAVRKARLLVIVAIIACAATVSTAIYIFASKSDQESFELEVSSDRDGQNHP
jgi:hypothetical protein